VRPPIAGRAFAVLEALLGQLYLVTVVAVVSPGCALATDVVPDASREQCGLPHPEPTGRVRAPPSNFLRFGAKLRVVML
jgi:hypothetical protein